MEISHELSQIFSSILSAKSTEEIKYLETLLISFREKPDFLSKLLIFLENPEISLEIRQLALIELSNLCQKARIPNEKKPFLYEKLEFFLEKVYKNKKISCLLEKSINELFSNEKPENLLIFIEKFTINSDFELNRLFSRLSILKSLVKSLEVHKIEPKNTIFSIIIEILRILLSNFSEEKAFLSIIIMKTLYSLFKIEFLNSLQNQAEILSFFTILKTFLEFPIEIPIENANLQIETRCFDTMKKWAFYLLLKIAKFSSKKVKTPIFKVFLNKETSEFAEYSFKYLNKSPFFKLPPKIHLSALKFLEFSLKQQKFSINSLDFILKALIPSIFLTKDYENLWNSDPQEWICREESPDCIENAIQKRISNVIMLMIEKDQNLANNFNMKMKEFFQAEQKTEIWLYQEAFMRIAYGNSQFTQEPMIMLMLNVGFSSALGLLRARACILVSEIQILEFKDAIFIEKTIESLANCLQDSELPVRYFACLGLNFLIDDERVQHKLKPIILTVTELLLKLMDKIYNEQTVCTLEKIIELFSVEISGISTELLRILIKNFLQYAEKRANMKKNQEEEAELAGIRILEAIKTLIEKKHGDLDIQGLDIIWNFAFRPENNEFLKPAVEILALLMKNNAFLDERLVLYFPITIYTIIGVPRYSIENPDLMKFPIEIRELLAILAIHHNGFEYLEVLMGCLAAFIAKFKGEIMNRKDLFGNSFIELIGLLVIGSKNEAGFEKSLCLHLFVFILEKNEGLAWNLYEEIASLALENTEESLVKAKNVEIIFMMIQKENLKILSFMENKGVFKSFFDSFIEKTAHLQGGYKGNVRIVLGLIAIFKHLMSSGEIALIFSRNQVDYRDLFRCVVRIVQKLTVLREIEESLLSDDSDQEINEEEAEKGFYNTLKQIKELTGNADNNVKSLAKKTENIIGNTGYLETDDWEENLKDYYQSPFEEIDELLLMDEFLISLRSTNPSLHSQLIASLTEEDRKSLEENLLKARNSQ